MEGEQHAQTAQYVHPCTFDRGGSSLPCAVTGTSRAKVRGAILGRRAYRSLTGVQLVQMRLYILRLFCRCGTGIHCTSFGGEGMSTCVLALTVLTVFPGGSRGQICPGVPRPAVAARRERLCQPPLPPIAHMPVAIAPGARES